MNNKTEHHNLMLRENGYPHLAVDRDEEPVLILSESGMPVLQTMQGCTMPADYSFACINNYVHCEDPEYEDLQNLALGMAAHIEKLERKLAEALDESKIESAVIDKLSRILAGIAIALKGEELPLHRHSYHDLVEKTQVAMLEIELMKVQIAESSKDAEKWRERDATLTQLRAWFTAQRKSISKGNGSSWDMLQCDEQIELIDVASKESQ